MDKNLKDDIVTNIIENDEKLIYYIAKKYEGALMGYELEDLKQEVILSFYDTLNYYDESLGVDFKTLAYQNAMRRFSNIKRKQDAGKRKPKQIIYYEQELKESSQSYGDVYLSEKIEEKLEMKIIYEDIIARAKDILTELEYDILISYIHGLSVKEIAKRYKLDTRAVSNRIYRIKNKLKEKIKI